MSKNPTITNHSIDDLVQLMGGHQVFSRVPCVGTMDLTQNTVFYTVECDPTLLSTLQVDVTNPGGAITRIEAALYGPNVIDSFGSLFEGYSFKQAFLWFLGTISYCEK